MSFATLASYSSGVTGRAKPERRRAPGAASTTYHISVLPCEPVAAPGKRIVRVHLDREVLARVG